MSETKTPYPTHLTLGQVIATLEAANPDAVMPIGFTDPHSYRGYYNDLAFILTTDVPVRDVLAAAHAADGETYQGWKGGDYTMGPHTDVWLVADEGNTGEPLGAVLLHLMLEMAR